MNCNPVIKLFTRWQFYNLLQIQSWVQGCVSTFMKVIAHCTFWKILLVWSEGLQRNNTVTIKIIIWFFLRTYQNSTLSVLYRLYCSKLKTFLLHKSNTDSSSLASPNVNIYCSCLPVWLFGILTWNWQSSRPFRDSDSRSLLTTIVASASTK